MTATVLTALAVLVPGLMLAALLLAMAPPEHEETDQ